MKIINKTGLLYALLLLGATFSVYTMEQSALEKPTWQDYIAYVGAILLGNTELETGESLPLAQLPLEVKSKIVSLLLLEKSADTLNIATKTINSLTQLNKELSELINNPDFCLHLIKRLAQRFSCSDQEVAEALQTKEAKQRLEIQKQFLTLCQEANFNEEEFNMLYEKYKQYIDLNFIFYSFDPNQKKIEVTLLIEATKKNSCPAIQTILKHGAAINKATPEGGTALMYAAINGNTNTFQCLLTNPNITIDQQDNIGVTSLMLAAMRNNCPVIQTLLTHRANINKATYTGLTALMFAVGNQQLDAIQCLLNDPNVIVDQQDDKEGTALLIAIEINNCPIIQTLLKHGANINKTRSNGITPLMFAVMHKNTDTIQCLLNRPNIVIDKQDIEGTTALLGSILFLQDRLIIKQLLDAGADPEIADNKDLTPLQAAQETGDQEIIDLIQNAINKKHRKIKKWSKK